MTAKAVIEIQEAATQIRAFEDVIPGFTPLQRLVYQDGAPVFHWSLQLKAVEAIVPWYWRQKFHGTIPLYDDLEKYDVLTPIASGSALSQGEAEAEARLALDRYQQVESSRKPPVVIEIDL
jgi:hypothetical protein